MARLFTAASTEYLVRNSTPVTAMPFTFSCWFRSSSTTLDQCLMCVVDKDVTNNVYRVIARGTTGGDPLTAEIWDGSTYATATTSTGYSSSTWHHMMARFVSTTSRFIYIDGGSGGSNGSTVSPSGMNRIAIGLAADSTPAFPFSGAIAEAAIWSVDLGAAAAADLASRPSPLLVNPQNLPSYWPLGGVYSANDADVDVVGGFDLTPTNTPTTLDHPPGIFYPSRPMFVTAASAVGGVTIPVFHHHYQQLRG